jgi:hypothetical protein
VTSIVLSTLFTIAVCISHLVLNSTIIDDSKSKAAKVFPASGVIALLLVVFSLFVSVNCRIIYMEREILVDRLSAIQEEIDAEDAKTQNQETAR